MISCEVTGIGYKKVDDCRDTNFLLMTSIG